jgi:ATP-dependent Clp protease ATP-binding subunit ClpA
MYERFTDRARKVMQLANQEARRFRHEYIGTEHILLGLAEEGSGVAAHVLKNLDLDLRKLRAEVEKIMQSGPDPVTCGKLPQTPRAKKVVEYAIEEARNLNHNYVGTEHLLLGLLREECGVAAVVLTNLGLKLEQVRAEILNLLGHALDRREQDLTRKGSAICERATCRARRALRLANREARRLRQDYLGTEHLLLGLLKEGRGVAATVLQSRGVDLEKARREVETLVRPGQGKIRCGRLPQTPRVKRAIEHGIEEVHRLGHESLDTGHMLLGLLRDEESTAGQVLAHGFGLQAEELRKDVLAGLNGHTSLSEVSESSAAADSLANRLAALERGQRELRLLVGGMMGTLTGGFVGAILGGTADAIGGALIGTVLFAAIVALKQRARRS